MRCKITIHAATSTNSHVSNQNRCAGLTCWRTEMSAHDTPLAWMVTHRAIRHSAVSRLVTNSAHYNGARGLAGSINQSFVVPEDTLRDNFTKAQKVLLIRHRSLYHGSELFGVPSLSSRWSFCLRQQNGPDVL